jgi:uncharacterized protein YyaL (SSP411 family)
MPNRLIHEKSPYLLQHAHNPVEWYPWGPEAFEAARAHNKPVFLSVGYATCHWCHVMEKESFEDPEAAAALNRTFVCIKVDREERPDIDAVYMAACQMVTGRGGWPLTIMMTPDRKPFFAATYIPKTSRFGRPGLIDLCEQITALAGREPSKISESADAVVARLADAFAFEADPQARPEHGLLDRAVDEIASRYDAQHGGFDGAPKFPMAHRLLFLLNRYARGNDPGLLKMITHSLTAMRLGGLWDHVGYGFHRYATDNQWLLPHFEKMLYDQAWLAMAYTRAFELTGEPLFESTARDILTYVLRDMTAPQGGFYAAEDADSEGEEGKFYLWSLSEFEDLAGGRNQGPPWSEMFNLHAEGNFLEESTRRKTGTNILHLTRTPDQWARQVGLAPAQLSTRWEALRQKLFQRRFERIPPLKDDKILTDWNGMMMSALAQAARVLKDNTYARAAGKAADFVMERLRHPGGGMLHRFRDGQAAIAATANDYAFMIMGLIDLHYAEQVADRLQQAIALQEIMDTVFWDQDRGGYFLTARESDELPVRPKEIYDGAIPSANGVALNNLYRLWRLTGEQYWRDQALTLLRAFAGSVQQQPMAFTHTLTGWHLGVAEE